MAAKQNRPGWRTEAASENNFAAEAHTTRCLGPGWEPSAWLRAAIVSKVAQINALGPRHGWMAAPLDRPAVSGTREDHTCDRCRDYDPARFRRIELVFPGLVLVGGLCGDCFLLKVGQ